MKRYIVLLVLCLSFMTVLNALDRLLGGQDRIATAASRDQYRTLMPALARTASVNTDFAFDNTKYRGVLFVFDCSSRSGTTPTLDIKFQHKDPISGNYVDIVGAAFAQKNATGTDTLALYPAIVESANRRVSAVVSPDMRVVTTIGGTSTPTFTYSVSMIYLP